MNIIKNRKIRIRIIVFTLVTALIVGMIIFIPKIQKMMENAKWKKGIYILPVSEYHAFRIDEDTTITQLNFVCVKESEETFLSFLKEYHFVLSNNDGDELELVFQESFHFIMQHQSIDLIKESELYKHYSISFLLEFSTRENREFDSISIYKNETSKKSLNIGRLTYDFFNDLRTISPYIYGSVLVTSDSFPLNIRYSVIDYEDDYIIESLILKLTDAAYGLEPISASGLFYFPINALCNPTTCSAESFLSFTTTNDFLTYTLKPRVKYITNDTTYFDTYRFPTLYHRVLADDTYFEVSDTFTNILD